MVARKLLVEHNHSHFHVDYETEDGLDVLKFQLFSLTSIPPDDQKIFGENNQFIGTDSELHAVADKLRLVSINDDAKDKVDEEIAGSSSDAADLLKSDEEFARRLQAEVEELFSQQFLANENRKAFEERIRPYVRQVLQYEDPVRQEAAHKTVPVDELEEKALVSLAKDGNFRPSKQEEDHAFLLQLLFWFKHSFRWVNSPPCNGCGNGTNFIGMGGPLTSEIQFGGSRVELYRCNSCTITTRFPRYNDPLKLVETRRGRCGEWANCFTLYCRAFGYESRLILDFTDHVWTECYSEYLGRWMHLDPCEGIYDNPLLYETGWGKKLNYVIGIAKDGVYDVTRRYTRKWHEVLSRRNITTEPIASAVLIDMRNECRKHLTSEEISKLKDHERKEAEELERGVQSHDADLVRLPGRQSGAKEWRLGRRELGINKTDSWSSSCPLRICVDEHVTKIFNALSHLLSELISNDFSKAISLELLELFKRIMVDIQKISFKVRKASMSTDNGSLLCSMDKVMPSIDGLLAALSLKRESLNDGKAYICLAGDPVKTSLALPVALDAIDNGIFNVRSTKCFGAESLSLPLLKFNRICSGSVIASGEELPFGIVTSAFDGSHFSKWEEPNGAKGCWIIYLVKDGEMHNLQAYELASANDAPERDPMDWIVEGSADGGSSWHVLDKQKSQLFERRFQRITFLIEPNERLSNAFRFSFSAVRDGNAQSRLQIGSIDLYAKAS